MSTTIDATGLPAPVVQDLQRLVDTLRTATTPDVRAQREQLSAEEWVRRWREFIASHARPGPIADDSRESIYEGRGE